MGIRLSPQTTPPPRPSSKTITLVGREPSHAQPAPRGSVVRDVPSYMLAIEDRVAPPAAQAPWWAKPDFGGATGSEIRRRYREVRQKLLADAAARWVGEPWRAGASWPRAQHWALS